MKPILKIAGAGVLVGLLLGFAAGVEWELRQASADEQAMLEHDRKMIADWRQTYEAMQATQNAPCPPVADSATPAPLASPDEPQQKDPGNLLPEIDQPGAETLEQQQAAAAAAAAARQRQIEAAAAIARALTR